MRLARFLAAVGRTCITAGVLILLFVAYQLWGTGLRAAQAQNGLERDFTAILEGTTTTSPTTSTTGAADPASTTTVAPTVPPIAPVAEGEATAHITVPKIGLDWIVVEGIALRDLKKGPGHYAQTPLPGQRGNAAIAGHRTTYGAPFNRIDELVPGDEIQVETVQGTFTYIVKEQQIVSPTQVDVIDDKGDNRLTLTACHPKYSARQRIVVVATLAADEVPLPPSLPPSDAAEPAPKELTTIGGAGAPAAPAIALGAACAAIWLLAWLVGRAWRRWPAYLLGLPVFLVALFFFFEEFSRLLPSDF